MAYKEELKTMVLQFKVSDLQVLLAFAGQNKHGRKHELQKKALNLINHKMSIPLEMKIRQMYRDILPENNTPKPTNGYYTPNNCPDKCNYYMNGHTRQLAVNPFETYNSMNYHPESIYDNFWSPSLDYYNWPSSTPVGSSSKITPPNPVNFNIKMPSNQNLNNVKFKKLPFYKHKSDILSVTPLMPRKQRGEAYEFTHSFSLDQQQLSLLNWSKKNDEFRYQVQLRICLLNEATDVDDDLPLALTVKVNDKNCQLPPAIPSTNKQGMLLKRMNAPINLSSQTSKKVSVNSLYISWSVTCDKLYGICIYLVKKYTSDELIEKLKQKGGRDPAITKKYLSDKLGQLEDDDIAATSLKVSMICPLGKIIMSLPVRATTCNHLQCFDGALYIKMNDVKSTWQCPVCNQSCFYENLFIDGYFVDVLKNNDFSSEASEIQIEADGSVTPVVQKRRLNPNASPTNPCKRFKSEEIESNKNSNSFVNEPQNFCMPVDYSTNSSIAKDENSVSSCSTNDDSAEYSASENSSENQAKRPVVLVDLTESDSEQSDQQMMPLNLKKYVDKTDEIQEASLCWNGSNFISIKKDLPPIYDIEDFD